MTAQELRASLLREAVTGRLVPQRAEEGSAEALYEEIRQEKARLVAEKKIKKEKPLPPVTKEEQPFSIPATWKWIRLGNCGNWYSGTTPSRTRPDYYGGSIPWLKTGDLNDGLITNTSEKITELACKETSVHLNPAGAVLIAMYGATIGRLGLLSMESTTNQACCACTTYSGVFNKFLFFFLLAWRPNFIKQGAGGAQPNISKEKIINTPFPLPPLAEQKRIVDKLEELLPLVDAYGEAEQRLAAYEDRFPDTLKRSLLQEAITGRLVPQRAEEGSAETLYEEIRQEKARLIAEKKLKKTKPLPPVTEEEQLFPIPASWKWIRLEDVCSMKITDGTHQTPKYATKDNGIPFLSAKDITTQKICWDNIKYITTDLHEELYKRIAPQKDDVLLAKNGTTGVAALVEENKIFDIYVTLAVLRPEKRLILPQFLWRLVNSPVCKRQFDSHLKGIGVPNLHLTEIRKILIPLPPLAEQKRIVDKLEELLALAEHIHEARR